VGNCNICVVGNKRFLIPLGEVRNDKLLGDEKRKKSGPQEVALILTFYFYCDRLREKL
jgi:hypothetical protein